jgi:hypothetical protein
MESGSWIITSMADVELADNQFDVCYARTLHVSIQPLFSLFSLVESPFATTTHPQSTTSIMFVRVVARKGPLLKNELDKVTIVTAS